MHALVTVAAPALQGFPALAERGLPTVSGLALAGPSPVLGRTVPARADDDDHRQPTEDQEDEERGDHAQGRDDHRFVSCKYRPRVQLRPSSCRVSGRH